MTSIMRSGVVVASAVLVAACASGGAMMSTPDAIAARQKLMKEQGAASRSIQEKLKTGQIQAIAADAEKLAASATKITELFPKDSLDPKTSRAKPEIWQKWAEFEQAAKTLQTRATALAAVARTGDADKTKAALATFGKQACGGCHTPFRGPEIKK